MPTENTQSVCKHCHEKIFRAHGSWQTSEGFLTCMHNKSSFSAGHEPLAERASTGEPPDYCQCGAIGVDSSGKCAVCRKPVPGAESDGFSAIIKCHTQEALDKLHDPEKLRMLIGASIDGLMLQEEIDYTLEVRRDYK